MAMDTFNATVTATLGAIGTKAGDFAPAGQNISYTKSTKLTLGTGADQANDAYGAYRTLTAATGEDLDLSGALTNGFGGSVVLTKVKALFIENTSATMTLEVGGAASNAVASFFGDATDIIKIPPGGFILLSAPGATGYAVTAGTGDILKVNNPGASSTTYRIIVIGA